jgi:hypothetical protein
MGLKLAIKVNGSGSQEKQTSFHIGKLRFTTRHLNAQVFEFEDRNVTADDLAGGVLADFVLAVDFKNILTLKKKRRKIHTEPYLPHFQPSGYIWRHALGSDQRT